ncbi:phospholipase D-like domain-containing protein [Paracoccus sp. (in: a-proteobacteria)]|uniref:phospholipase D-like domain-containing protein n=1 Tax=Paracoccus sp. TaxID=267 RepID=UPI003A853C93
MSWLRGLARLLFLLVVLWFVGRLVFAVPGTDGRPPETALPFDPTTAYGPAAVEAATAHAGQSGVAPLGDPHAALQSRISLANRAERSIDAMYYIWHDDISGNLLLDALRRAAERGVRVRLLLDDNGITGMDQTLAALNAMPNFSVRLFNPATVRQPKALGYLLYPLRMNRRMHNKAFVVDGAAVIVGGRNIGDEYFATGDAPAYLDLDVLGVGKVVSDTAAIFDEYWNAVPVLRLEQVIGGNGDLVHFTAAVRQAQAAQPEHPVPNPAERLGQGQLALEWTDVRVVADDPAKGMGGATRDQLMITRLGKILGGVDARLDLVSAYFVPGQAGTRFFTGLARQGKEVRILTNSWQATDVPMVHAGYVKYRRELLEAGVTLYELRPAGAIPQGRQELHHFGASGASLHAKTFWADDARVFIGSFNFDPRSALLNCEMGFLIESPTIATAADRTMTDELAARSYRPMLQGHDMVWQDTGGAVLDHEPGLGTMDRIKVYILNVLPIEWLL